MTRTPNTETIDFSLERKYINYIVAVNINLYPGIVNSSWVLSFFFFN
jgi:hypothetical protein